MYIYLKSYNDEVGWFFSFLAERLTAFSGQLWETRLGAPKTAARPSLRPGSRL